MPVQLQPSVQLLIMVVIVLMVHTCLLVPLHHPNYISECSVSHIMTIPHEVNAGCTVRGADPKWSMDVGLSTSIKLSDTKEKS